LELAKQRGAKQGMMVDDVSSLEEQNKRITQVQLQVKRVEQVTLNPKP
jgi:hypothetical protein